MSADWIPCARNHCWVHREIISEPLSVRKYLGAPYSSTNLASVRTTRSDGIELAPSSSYSASSRISPFFDGTILREAQKCGRTRTREFDAIGLTERGHTTAVAFVRDSPTAA